MKISHIFFDLDGTIIDSEPVAIRVIEECLAEFDVTISREDVNFIIGRKWEEVFHVLNSRYKLPVSGSEMRNRILTHYRNHLKNSIPVVSGSVEAIKKLSKRYCLALVSGSDRTEILWVLEKLSVDKYFKVILGAEDYTNSKPSPDSYIKAMELLGAKNDKCLVFEDSEPGVLAGIQAGMSVVAITATNHFKHDLSRAHFKIHDFTSVNAKWVENL